jgi:hypothetical protein
MVIFHSKLQIYQMVINDDVWCNGVMLDTPAETVFSFFKTVLRVPVYPEFRKVCVYTHSNVSFCSKSTQYSTFQNHY